MPTAEEEKDIRKYSLATEQLNFKYDYNKHCIEQVHVHNQVAEKFLTEEMNANFLTTNNYVKNDEEAPFQPMHQNRHEMTTNKHQGKEVRTGNMRNPCTNILKLNIY